jgi:hypothetical protein
VLTIIDANATPSPSRAYAEAAWRANPSISPSWWRENLGYTHSKLAYDGRAVRLAPRALEQGVNLVLATPATMPQGAPDGVVTLLQSAELHAPAEVLLLPTAGFDDDALLAALVVLERRVANGTLQAYGVADEGLASPRPPRPLHQLLALATQAAEQAWGRKKRPSLRVVLAPLDVLDWQLLLTPNTRHKDEAVSALELAARLGLWVLVAPRVQPTATASAAALAALTTLAEAEARLHQQLRGQWPHVAGQPLFSALKLLQAGHAPWPTPAMASVWRTEVWPQLRQQWALWPEASPLLAQWQVTLPWVAELAAAAAAPLAAQAIAQWQLPAPWAALSATLQQLAVLASVPGVGAVLTPPTADIGPLLSLPDYPDVGALLAPVG